MYRITTNNNRALWDPAAGITLIEPRLELKENSAGSLTFKIDPTHHLYGSLNKYTSYIDIEHNGIWLWSGRVLNTSTDINSIITVTAEGEQAYLNDIVQRPKEYHNISIRDYLIDVVENIYDPQVPAERRFKIGLVTIQDSNNSIYKISNYENTWELLSDRLLGTYGGFFRIRHSEGIKYLDYLKEYAGISPQHIAYGENLLDLILTINGEDFATAVIPLGQRDSETDTRLTITSVNGSKDYVQDDELVTKYGLIFKVVEHDDVTVPANLMAKGYEDLAKCKVFSGSIEARAADLNLVDDNVESFRVGDLVLMDSAPHGLDIRLNLRQITIPFASPQDMELVLGTEFKTMSNDKLHADKVINEIKADYVKNEQLKEVSEDITEVKQAVLTNTSLIEQLPENILLEVESEYSKVTSVDYIQKLIDGTALKWSGEGPPTVGANTGMWYAIPKRIPFVMHTWGGDGKAREEHIGDIYTDILTGKKYVFRRSEGEDEDVFLWEYLEENAYLYDVSRLDMKSDAVRLSVDKLSSDVGKQSAEIVMLSDRISSKVEGSLFSSTADQLAESISQKISKGGEVISEINQSGGIITLSSNRLVINSTYFSVTSDGHITATAGNIGGFYIGASYLANNTNRLNYLGEPGITPGDTPDQCVYIGTDGVSLGKKFKVTSDGVMYANQFTSEGHFAGVSGIPGGEAGTVKAAMNNANFKFYFNGSDKGGIYYGYKKIKSANYVGVTLDAEMAEVDTFHCKTNFYYRDRYFDIVDGYLRAI